MKIKILAAGIALTLPFWACAKDVTIIYTNDLHAHVEPYKVPWIADGKRDIGGFSTHDASHLHPNRRRSL